MSYQLLRSALIATLLSAPYPLAAQTAATLTEQFIEMTAVTGYEQTAAEQHVRTQTWFTKKCNINRFGFGNPFEVETS